MDDNLKNIASNQEDLIYDFKYAPRKSQTIILLSIFGLCGIFFGYLAFTHDDNTPIFVSLGSFLFCIVSLYMSKFEKRLKVYKDRIEVPKGLWSKKINTVLIEEITDVVEIGYEGAGSIKIIQKLNKPVLIGSNLLSEHDYYEALEYLEKCIEKKTKEILSPIDKEKAERKVKIAKWVGVGLLPALVLGSRYFTGNLKTTEEWKSAIWIIGFLYAVGLLQGVAAKSISKHSRDKRKELSRPEVKKLKNRWSMFMYSPALLGMGGMFIILKIPYQGASTLWPFVVYGIAFTMIFYMFLNKVAPDVDGVMSNGERWTAYIVCGFLFTAFSTFMFVSINRNFDDSEGVLKQSYLTGKWAPPNYKNHFCYKIANWETGEAISAGDSSYCTYDNLRYQDKDKIELVVYEGFLGVPWFKDIQFVKFKSPEDAIRENGSELDLRSIDIQLISKKLGNKVWDSYYEKWNKSCYSDKPSNCRLAAYITRVRGDKELTLKTIKYGCSNKDFYTCYSYFFFKELPVEDMKIAKENMLEQCKGKLSSDKKGICDFVNQVKLKTSKNNKEREI